MFCFLFSGLNSLKYPEPCQQICFQPVMAEKEGTGKELTLMVSQVPMLADHPLGKMVKRIGRNWEPDKTESGVPPFQRRNLIFCTCLLLEDISLFSRCEINLPQPGTFSKFFWQNICSFRAEWPGGCRLASLKQKQNKKHYVGHFSFKKNNN